MFTFILEEIVDMLVELMIERDIDNTAGGHVCDVRLLSGTQLDAFHTTLGQYSVHIARVKTRL